MTMANARLSKIRDHLAESGGVGSAKVREKARDWVDTFLMGGWGSHGGGGERGRAAQARTGRGPRHRGSRTNARPGRQGAWR